MPPAGSSTSSRICGLVLSSPCRSGVGFCHQSTSPADSALAAVEASGTIRHSTRSKYARFGPAVKLAAPSGRGT